MKFPKDFIWGAATSSYQIEGAAYRDGGGRSTWDMLGRHDGKIAGGDTGESACEHYRHYRDDVGLMAGIGFDAYRFSVSWPRVLPEGIGSVNQRGLDFYSRLVDALLERGITPWLTLFHWDFPYELYCRGGWLNRDSADWFADYAAIVVDALSDRVAHWCTINEPQVYIGLGHHQGVHAPGLQMGLAEALLAGHHTLLAHGKATQVIRARASKTPVIGAAHAGTFYIPDSASDADVEIARQLNFGIREQNFFNNTWFSDAMHLGRYPADGVELFADAMPRIRDGDLETIGQPLDYFGANVYWGSYVRDRGDGEHELVVRHDYPHTDMGWPITPEVLYWAPTYFTERYALPYVVLENGLAYDGAGDAGPIHDGLRIDFMREYLREYGRAIRDGAPCLGYFQWSLLDNFEWAEGYAKRFGIIHVDFATQQRTLKDSAHWYRQVIAANEIADGRADRAAGAPD